MPSLDLYSPGLDYIPGVGPFADPWRDMASIAMPSTMPQALRYCEYIVLNDGTYQQALNRCLSYFITDVEFSETDEVRKEEWEEFFEEKIGIRNVLQLAGLDCSCYGNSFVSLLPVPKWHLVCRCGASHPIKVVHDNKIFRWSWSDLKASAFCPSCKYYGEWKMVDRSAKDADSFVVKRWNPHEIEILWDHLTGKTAYIWRIPEEYRRLLRKGDIFRLEHTSKEVLDAVRNNCHILFEKDFVYHMREDTLAGIRNRGWGISRVLTNFRQAWQVQVFRRQNEAIGLDYVVPHRLITPETAANAAVDPMQNFSLGDFRSQMMAMIAGNRQDPARISISPFPVKYQTLGGDANNFAPVELLANASETLLNNIGVPVDFFKGTMQAQVFPVAARLFESTHANIPHNLNGLINFLTRQASKYLRWEPVGAKLARPSHADDIQRQAARLQLMLQGAGVSPTTAFKGLGLDFHDEKKKELADQKFVAEQQADLQKEMDQAAQMEEAIASLVQGGNPAVPGGGGAPQGGGAPSAGAPQGQAGMAQQSIVDSLPTGPNQKITPQELQQRANNIAQKLFTMPESQKDSELIKLKNADPVLHRQVKGEMEQIRQRAKQQGGQQVLAQQFGKQGSVDPELEKIARRNRRRVGEQRRRTIDLDD